MKFFFPWALAVALIVMGVAILLNAIFGKSFFKDSNGNFDTFAWIRAIVLSIVILALGGGGVVALLL